MPDDRHASRNKIHVDDDCLAGHDCMAMSQGLATAQSSSIQREAPSAPSITALDGSGASPSSIVKHGLLNQEETTLCSLSVPNTVPQPSPEGDGTTPTGTHVSYASLSDRCKFRLFLRTTYSPYTFASAGFEATEAQASGHIMAWVCKVGVSDSVRLWRTQNRADSSRGMLCLQSCITILDISPRPRKGSSRGHGIPQPGW